MTEESSCKHRSSSSIMPPLESPTSFVTALRKSSAVPTSINPELSEPLPRGLNLGTMLIGVSYRELSTIQFQSVPTIRGNSSNCARRTNEQRFLTTALRMDSTGTKRIVSSIIPTLSNYDITVYISMSHVDW